jgi:hypothetical protein
MYEFVAHLLTWPTRVRGTLHVHVHVSTTLYGEQNQTLMKSTYDKPSGEASSKKAKE